MPSKMNQIKVLKRFKAKESVPLPLGAQMQNEPELRNAGWPVVP